MLVLASTTQYMTSIVYLSGFILRHKTAAAKRLKLFTNSSVFMHPINSDGNKTRVHTQLISSTLAVVQTGLGIRLILVCTLSLKMDV